MMREAEELKRHINIFKRDQHSDLARKDSSVSSAVNESQI